MRTPTQDKNLDKLITGLESLPADYDNFDMATFADEDEAAFEGTPKNPCGAPACIVGHGPSFGIPVADKHVRFFDAGIFVDWDAYSVEAFGYSAPKGGRGDSTDWQFCFGMDWPDDIPEAIARLKLARDYNIPDEWDYEDTFA